MAEFVEECIDRGCRGGRVTPALGREPSEARELFAARVDAIRPGADSGIRLGLGQAIAPTAVEALVELVLEAAEG
jgi:hypothetical protein